VSSVPVGAGWEGEQLRCGKLFQICSETAHGCLVGAYGCLHATLALGFNADPSLPGGGMAFAGWGSAATTKENERFNCVLIGNK